jgi:hypothetical protein
MLSQSGEKKILALYHIHLSIIVNNQILKSTQKTGIKTYLSL